MAKPKHPGGRPTDYTQELADKICAQLATGMSLRVVCLAEDMPSTQTVFNWIRTKDGFIDQYARAKEESADADAENLEAIGDEAILEAKTVNPKSSGAVVSAYKLKADNIKWAMSKKKPKKYGDKLDMTTNGKDLPAPILNHVLSDHSDKEDTQA